MYSSFSLFIWYTQEELGHVVNVYKPSNLGGFARTGSLLM